MWQVWGFGFNLLFIFVWICSTLVVFSSCSVCAFFWLLPSVLQVSTPDAVIRMTFESFCFIKTSRTHRFHQEPPGNLELLGPEFGLLSLLPHADSFFSAVSPSYKAWFSASIHMCEGGDIFVFFSAPQFEYWD